MEFIDRALVITDLETTGLDPLIHEVIDIGAVRVDQATLEIEATFSAKIQPLHIELASPIALEVNGYTPEAWKHAVNQSDGWRSFFSFARQSVFASYSTRFDWGFTNEALRFYYPNQQADRSREEYGPFERHLIDIPSIAWGVLGPLPKIGKDPVATFLGIGPEDKPHDGLRGALHALKVLKELRSRGWVYAKAA